MMIREEREKVTGMASVIQRALFYALPNTVALILENKKGIRIQRIPSRDRDNNKLCYFAIWPKEVLEILTPAEVITALAELNLLTCTKST